MSRETLTPLTAAAVRELARASSVDVGAEELYAATGGNPFFVTEVLAAPGPSTPVTVRDAVLGRIATLSEESRQMLTAAAVLACPTTLDQLTAVAGVPATAVDDCVRRGVLVVDDRGLRFRHELARRTVEDTLLPGLRAQLHARALRVLRASGERDQARLAAHAVAAGDASAVLELAPRAAANAARLGAHREAAEGYRIALRHADGVLGDVDLRRRELLEALAYECYLTDGLEEALTARRGALDIAERSGDAREVGRNQCWISRLCWPLGRRGESETFAARAVATLEAIGADGADLAMAYSNLAQRRMLAGDTSAAVAAGNRAIDLARRIGDREVEIDALTSVGTALASVDDDAEGIRLLRRSLDLALLDDAHELAARAWTNLGSIAVRNRRLAEADRLLRDGSTGAPSATWTSGRCTCARGSPGRWPSRGASTGPTTQPRRCCGRPHLSADHPDDRPQRRRHRGLPPGQPERGPLGEALALAAVRGPASGGPDPAGPGGGGLAGRPRRGGVAGRAPATSSRRWTGLARRGALRNPWTLGELCWWSAVAGLRRSTAAPARPRPSG